MRFAFSNWLAAGLAPFMVLAGWVQSVAATSLETPLWEFSPSEYGSGSWDLNVFALPQADVIWFQRDWSPAAATSFTPQGQALAAFRMCNDCRGMTVAADGSVWVKELAGTFSQRHWAVRRYSSMGEQLKSVDLEDFPQYSQLELFPDGDELDVVVFPNLGQATMQVLRIAEDGSHLRSSSILLSHFEGLQFVDHRRAPDGGLILLMDRHVGYLCAPIQPCYWAPRVSMLGLAPTGDERWRVEPNWPTSSQVLGRGMDEQGRSWIVRTSPEGMRLLVVDAEGLQSEERILQSGIAGGQFIGPIDGLGMMRNGLHLTLFDEQGALRASRLMSTCFMTVDYDYSEHVITPFGYLLSRCQGTVDNFDATLFDPQTLAIRGQFDLDGQPAPYFGHERALGRWLALPDGSLYAAVEDHRGAHLAKFAIPGTAAYRPFGSGFEAQP